MIIAVDGPSAAGKGTLARGIAKALGYHFLDTGSLYRMVGFSMLQEGKLGSDAAAATAIALSLKPETINDADLRSEDVAAMASEVAVIPEVRQALLEFQRSFARKATGCGARWPRHRHCCLPQCRSQILRDSRNRRPRPPTPRLN